MQKSETEIVESFLSDRRNTSKVQYEIIMVSIFKKLRDVRVRRKKLSYYYSYIIIVIITMKLALLQHFFPFAFYSDFEFPRLLLPLFINVTAHIR